VRVFLRDAKKIAGQSWAHDVEIVEGNANNPEDLLKALHGVHTAYYLLHSINVSTNFGDIESAMALGFALLVVLTVFMGRRMASPPTSS
jgi:uncharacterized protein YbjT (DUF2867 family)